MQHKLEEKEVLRCPNCGASDFKPVPSTKYERCTYCGTEFLRDEPEPVSPPPEPAPETELPKPKSLVDLLVLAVMLTIAAGLFGALCFWIYNNSQEVDRYSAKVNTIGQYTLPEIDCGTEKIVAEYGFKEKPPILSTTLTDGKGRWKISTDVLSQIVLRRKSEVEYLWVHCDNPEKQPAYFVRYYSGTSEYPGGIPLPADGQEVVIRK